MDANAKEETEGGKLEKTATNMFNILLAGFIVMLAGTVVYVFGRRRMKVK